MSSLNKAKASQPLENAWRVDNYSHTASDYVKCKTFVSDGGSTLAVTVDGDIISVCKKRNDTAMYGKDLIEKAVEKGGVKLDSYDGNYAFYRKCGFEPVSWTKWNDEYAPDDWKKEYGGEDIIFFKYTGNKTNNYESLRDFKKRVVASDDYDTAERIQDKSVKNE